MIELTGSQLRLVREQIARCLAPLPRGRITAVCFEGGPSGLIVRAKGEHAAIEWRCEGDYPSERLVVALDALKQCSPSRSAVVTLENAGAESVIGRWSEKQIPQSIECFGGEFTAGFPSVPPTMAANGPELLAALRDAGEVVDKSSHRFALECLQLRGTEGQIGTDGGQALVQGSFAFPWEGELLVRANRIFASEAMNTGMPIQIGKSDDWVTLKSGSWTVHLAIVKEGRYPNLQSVLPEAGSEAATMHLAAEDAQFLIDAIDRLPANKDALAPVTIDLNGHVTLCARDAEAQRGTAVILSNSRWSGEAVRFHTNRKFLARAARLGFRDVRFPGADGPAWCSDGRRTYVWMSLAKELAVNPEHCTERIASPVSPAFTTADSPNQMPATRASEAICVPNPSTQEDQSMKSINGASPRGAIHSSDRIATDPQPETSRGAALVHQVDSLRSTLTQALGQLRELAVALRRRQKQSRLVETTLASLRQLKEVEV